MSRDLALAFTFSCIRAPDLSPRDRLRLGQTFGGVDEGGAVAAQGLNGEGPHVGGHGAVDEGGHETVGDDAGLLDGVGPGGGGAPVQHHVQGGEGEMFGGGHAAEGGGVGGHEALLKLARLAASGASLGRVRDGGQNGRAA